MIIADSLWDHWHFSVWLGPAIGLLGIAVTITLAVRNQPKKALEWAARFESMRLGPNATPNLNVSFMGRLVDDPYIISFRIANVGRLPIADDEFKAPLTISLPEVDILSVEVMADSDGVMRDHHLIPGQHGEAIVVEPNTYFNRRGWVEFRFLTEGKPSQVRVEAVVFGQTRSIRQHKYRQLVTFAQLAGSIAAFAAVLYVVSGGFQGKNLPLFVVCMVLFGLWFSVGVPWLTRRRAQLFRGYVNDVWDNRV